MSIIPLKFYQILSVKRAIFLRKKLENQKNPYKSIVDGRRIRQRQLNRLIEKNYFILRMFVSLFNFYII